MRICIIALLTGFFSISTLAQNQNNSILWRITGNGLTKPSYLFGTFHVKDKRVFYQNDSLKDFIKACEYFSLELHPDSMNSLLFDVYNGSDTSKYDKAFSSFSDEEYKLVDEKLQKDIGLGLSQIKNRNLKFIKTLLSPSVKKKDDYPTFLDGYLLNIARRLNKEIIGLESIASQASALNYMKTNDAELKNEIVKLSKEKENHEKFENLISYYQSEKIDLIHQLFTYQGLLTTDIVLYKRNVVMARTIDSIVRKNSFFAACGSAHLAGEQGVIQLLKNLGYELTPIASKKKSYLNADKFPLDPNVNWNKINLPSFGINYFLPGVPMAMKKSSVIAEAQMYSDITSGAVYMMLPINVSGSFTSKNEVYDKLAKSMEERLMLSSGFKKIDATEKGHDYRELTAEFKGFDITIRFYLENNIMYYLFATAPKNYDFSIEKKFFFSSVDFYSPVKQDLYYYRNQKWEIEMTLPGKPIEADYSSRSNNTIFSKISFKLTDNIENIHYIFDGSEAGEGRFYRNDTVLMNGITTKLKASDKTVWLKDSNFVFKNYKAKQITALFDDSSIVVCLSVVKGFKLFNVMAIMTKETYKKGTYKPTINSFNILNAPKQDYQWVKAPFDTTFSLMLPESLSEYKVTDENYYTYDEWKEPLYTAFEKNNGVTYYLTRKVESPYYYSTVDSVYWKNILHDIMDDEDSLVYQKDIKFGNGRARQFCILEKGATCATYYNICSFGKYYYKLFAYLPGVEKNDHFLQPFDIYKFTGKYKEEMVADTVAFGKLIDDIFSGDSVYVQRANAKFNYFKLTPAMYRTFEKITDTTGSETKYKFINKLHSFSFKETSPFISRKLFSFRKDSAYDDTYLNQLAEYKTKESFEVVKKFLLQNLKNTGDYYQTFGSFYDSLELAATLFPELAMAFNKDTSSSENFIRLTARLLDSSLIKYDILKMYEPDIKVRAMKNAAVKVKDENYWDHYFPDSYLDVAVFSKDNNFQREVYNILAKSNNIWGKFYAVNFALRSKLDIDPVLVATLCEMPYFRYRLFVDLKKEGKMEFYPTKHLNQKSLAEADLVVRILDNEEVMPSKVEFVKETQWKEKEKTITYCIFKISFKDVKEKYIGFAGPYSVDEPITESATNTYLGDEYEKGKEEELLIKFITKQQLDNY